jgi:hypothetical protein
MFRPKIYSIASRAALATSCLILAACAPQKDPPEATISWLAPQTRAAEPADCPIQMLSAPPNTDYQQIALVEVADDYRATDAEVAALVRRKACETGADALVILENQNQKSGGALPGYSGDSRDASSGSSVTNKGPSHAPDVGEVGHRGRFVDAVAIVYGKSPGSSATTDPR